MAQLRLMAAKEIARALDVTPSHLHQIIKKHPGFPAPVADLSVGRIWLAEDVEAWMRATGRAPAEEKADV